MNNRFLATLILLTLTGCQTLFTGDETVSISSTAEQKQIKSEEIVPQPIVPDEIIESDLVQIENKDLNNVWHRIKNQFSIEVPDNQRVRAQKSWYENNPTYMKRVTERATPYLYHIVEALEQNNLPLELALLPIVESAFDPFAYSHGRASGMWQFIPETATSFGLKQDWWYDGRRDVYHSTEAAIKFLTYLNKRFDGNWLHALAAYNSGEGNVGRAIKNNQKKGKNTDFWSLDLPNETQAYVPKLLALAKLLTESIENEATWTPIANSAYFERVNSESQIDLSLVASLADIEMSDFYELNPAYNQWATSPDGPHFVLLPVNKVATFQQNLAEIPKDQRISFKRYTIKPGDSLIKIAKQFSTSVQLLKDNNHIKNNSIRAGKELLIPVASQARDQYHKSSQQRLFARQNTQRDGRKITVEVASGDSMWDISRKYKVDIRSLAKWNNIAPTDPIKIGQKLVVWTTAPQKMASLSNGDNKTKKIHYKVRQGESLALIADKFNLKLHHLIEWNKQEGKKKYLQPGDLLTLYVDITRQF